MIKHGGSEDWGWKWLWLFQDCALAFACKECKKNMEYLIQAEAVYEPFTIQTQIRDVGAHFMSFLSSDLTVGLLLDQF